MVAGTLKKGKTNNGRLDQILEREVFEHLANTLKDTAEVTKYEDLKDYSSIKIGGIASIVVLPHTKEAIIETILYCQEKGIPYYVSGLGANSVFGDIPGVLINTKSLNKFIEKRKIIPADEVKAKDGRITAQAGVLLGRREAIRSEMLAPYKYRSADELIAEYESSLVGVAYEHSLGGIEGLADIPGTVGASTYLNSGGVRKQYTAQHIVEITIITSKGEKKTIRKGEPENGEGGIIHDFRERLLGRKGDRAEDRVSFRYRFCSLQKEAHHGDVIYAVTFGLDEGDQTEMREIMFENYSGRLEKLPSKPSVGSVFKKYGEDGSSYGVDEGGRVSADDLIREAECVGYEHPSGRIVVSTQYPLFLINRGGATINDFIETMEHVESRVFDRTGQKLIREVKFLPPLK